MASWGSGGGQSLDLELDLDLAIEGEGSIESGMYRKQEGARLVVRE